MPSSVLQRRYEDKKEEYQMRKMGFRQSFLAVLAVLAVCLGVAPSARTDLDAFEAALNPSGAAYEINPDEQGLLWISDFDAGQVWGVDPAGGFYKVYAVFGSPSDARHAEGWLWWADGVSNILGRVSTLNGAVTRWEVPGVSGFYGTALDAQGRLWVTDANSAFLYRLDPDGAELCTFSLPSGGMSSYVISDAGYLWLGDWVNEYLLRLQVSDNSLTSWSLPEGSSPFGMAVDRRGNLWYADQGLNVLARLDPTADADQLASYALPQGTLPAMVTVQGDLVWYTEQYLTSLGLLDLGPRRFSQKQYRITWLYPTSLGRLDPQTASHTGFTPTVESTDLAPSCASISPASSGSVTITTDDLAWSPVTYSLIVDENGWSIYQLPDGSLPWGIAATGQTLYMVDPDRQVLARHTMEDEEHMICLPLALKRH